MCEIPEFVFSTLKLSTLAVRFTNHTTALMGSFVYASSLGIQGAKRQQLHRGMRIRTDLVSVSRAAPRQGKIQLTDTLKITDALL